MSETVLTDTQETADATQETTAKSAATVEKTEESTLLGTENKTEAGKDGQSADDAAKKDTEAGKGAENKNETPEQKAEREKQETATKVVPEKYEFKVPEGMAIDQGLVDKFTPILKEGNITQGVAQKLADVFMSHQAAQIDAHKTAAIDFYNGMVKEWKADTIKELGADYEKQLALAAKAIDNSKIPGLREMANMTGVGNHPAFVKFAIWAGKLVSQDSFADSGNKRTPMDNDQARGEVLFPSSKK